MSALPPAPPLTPARWALAALLAAALFGLGAESAAIFNFLTRAGQAAFGALGLGETLAHWQQGTSPLVTTRSLPAVVSYGLLYVAVSGLLLPRAAARCPAHALGGASLSGAADAVRLIAAAGEGRGKFTLGAEAQPARH